MNHAASQCTQSERGETTHVPREGGEHVVSLNAPSVLAAPALVLRLNQCAFRSGDTLTLSASVTPEGTPQVVDVYVAVRLPDGSLLFLQGDGRVTTSVRPIVTGWTIAPFTGAVFRYIFGGGEPRGSYP